MQLFRRVAGDIDVAPLLAQVDAHPELWNSHAERRAHPASPHRETDDLWLRYRVKRELHRPEDYRGEHVSVWYHPAIDLLSHAMLITEALAERIGASHIGGVLMTRIPPGCGVYPHDDRGTWHAEHYTTKIWLPLRANPRCINECWDSPEPFGFAALDKGQGPRHEQVVMRAGEPWTFSNLMRHGVRNCGETERIVLIMCFRCG